MNIKFGSGTVRITDISQEEIYALLKCKCKLKIIANNPITNTVARFLYLLDRTDTNKIIISRAKKGIKKEEPVTLKEVIGLINNLYTETVEELNYLTVDTNKTKFKDIIEVVIDKDLYNMKKSLINLIPSMPIDFIEDLISIDYNTNVYIIKYNDGSNSKFISSLYYWPSTKDLYFFEPTGPIFSYNRPDRELVLDSIEDVFALFIK